MSGQLEVSHQSLGGCLIVRVAGDVDSQGARVLRDTLVGKVSAGDPRLIVDLTRVDAMDQAGLSALLAARQEAEAAGGSLRLAGVGPAVKAVLTTAGNTRALVVDDDLSDALEATMEAATVAPGKRQPVPRQSAAADLSTPSRDLRPR
jgi:anti-sigma B factor antagonist